ncbi:MAG: hypothetical protein HY658_06330 [Actinobacteria bacterium]|nr:hypothetical protein [Actinomycetota bacterium]
MRHWLALGLFGVLAGGAVASAMAQPEPPAGPSPRALEALAAIGRPSVPQPLAGDVEAGDDVFLHEGRCAEVRRAYLGPDAPVPEGATVRQEGAVLVVETVYGARGLGFLEQGRRCFYDLRRSPTLVLEGSGPLPESLESFRDTACYTAGPRESLLAEIPLPGGPHVLIVGPRGGLDLGEDDPKGPWEATLLRGAIRDLLGKEDAGPVGRWPATVEPGVGEGTALVETPGGGSTIRFRCTTGLFGLFGAAA